MRLCSGCSRAASGFQALCLMGGRDERGPGSLCLVSASVSCCGLFTLSVYSLLGLSFPIQSRGVY